MQTPLEIVFHGLPSSQEIEADIRRRAEKLDQLYPRITSCRVSIEAQHNPAAGREHTGPKPIAGRWCVHVEVRVPGGDLISTRDPHGSAQKYAHMDLHTLIHDSFRSTERQLIAFKDRQRDKVKHHAEPVTGQVAELNESDSYGYLLTNTGALLYFHRQSLIGGDFDRLKRGDRVQYVMADGDTGPTAAKVWFTETPMQLAAE